MLSPPIGRHPRQVWRFGCVVLGISILLVVYAAFHRPLSVSRHVRAIGGRVGWQALTIFAVDLRGTKCTDEDLDLIVGLGAIRYLELGDTAISDAGVRKIATRKSLTRLTLDGTNVTDASLNYLRDLELLQYLSVRRTRVTATGVKELSRTASRFEDRL